MNKKQLRAHLRKLRNSLEKSKKMVNDQAILQHLVGHPAYQEAHRIMSYLSFGSELNTWPIVDHMLGCGKEVYVPVVDEQKRCLLPTYFDHNTELHQSAFGMKEPQGGRTVLPDVLDLVIVPGLAFSPQGYRIGYGGGYYDRFLLQTSAVRIGLCYSQFIQEVPIDDWDQPVSWIITEQGVIPRLVQENLSS